MAISVAFHIGRGGHFNNAGHKSFNPNIHLLQDCFTESCCIIDSDPETGESINDKDWQLIDGGGNVILEGRDNINSKTGVLDWDGEYDTDIVKDIEDCDDDELQLIVDSIKNGDFVDEDVRDYIDKWVLTV